MQSQQYSKEKKYPISIHYMPGAGGNFFCRALNLHDQINWHEDCIGLEYEEKYHKLNYKSVLDRKTPLDSNWLTFEGKYGFQDHWPEEKFPNTPHRIYFSHENSRCNVRITNYTKKEWDWARRQLLWKNSTFCMSWMQTGLVDKHDVGVPLHTLWSFDTLNHSLKKVESFMQVNESTEECKYWREKLWNQWKQTWAPKEMERICDRIYYGPKD